MRGCAGGCARALSRTPSSADVLQQVGQGRSCSVDEVVRVVVAEILDEVDRGRQAGLAQRFADELDLLEAGVGRADDDVTTQPAGGRGRQVAGLDPGDVNGRADDEKRLRGNGIASEGPRQRLPAAG